MGQTDTIVKKIVLGEFTDGAEGRPTGSHFIAVVTEKPGGHQLQWNLTPSSWGYSGLFCSDDDIIAGKILEEIGRQNMLEGEDSKKKALDLLAAAGEAGIVLELLTGQWKRIESVSTREDKNFYIEGERSVPLLER